MSCSRRALCAWLLTGPVARAAAQALPKVNLLAELRWQDGSQAEGSTLDAKGGVTVGTGTGAVTTKGQIALHAGTRSADNDVLQQVRVLNGGTAHVRWVQAVPLYWAEALQSPRGRTTAVLRQGWVESATGVLLRPRWPGGTAPVDIELEAELPGSTNAAQAMVGTQMRVPLGEWVTVARSGAQSRQATPGTLSTSDVDRSQHRELQLRVSHLP